MVTLVINLIKLYNYGYFLIHLIKLYNYGYFGNTSNQTLQLWLLW